jgi:hypothetical protein
VIALFGCTNSEQQYPLTVDTVTVIEKEQFQGIIYTLVKRISGVQDKTVVFQVFDKLPKLDDCNRDLVKPIFEDSVEVDRPVIEVLVDVEDSVMSVTYGDEDVEVLEKISFVIN